MLLEAAVNGGADWLVTLNTRHLADGARQFGIRVCTLISVAHEAQPAAISSIASA